MASGNKEFGKRIKELRESKGLTQEQLAEKVGIDYQSISRLETGYYFTNYQKLEKISVALDCSLRDLFDFGHIKDNDELKEEIFREINKSTTSELRFIYKFIKDFREFKNS